eukprot:9480377-Pyramimonas_sp.AAC.1
MLKTKDICLTIIAPPLRKTTWGGWNGPFPVVQNDPGRGQVIARVGNRDVQVLHGDARHSLHIKALVTREIGPGNAGLLRVVACIASLLAGRPAMAFGHLPTKREYSR